MPSKKVKTAPDPVRVERLGFRLDEQTKDLIERAAHLECRKVTDFCVSVLADAAHRTIAEHETLRLSERDREVFFDTLVSPPRPMKGSSAHWRSTSGGSYRKCLRRHRAI